MNDELKNIYLDAMLKGEMYYVGYGYKFKRDSVPNRLCDIEKKHLGRLLSYDEMNDLPEFKQALKEWDEIRNSPLYQALLENDE